MHNKSCLPSAQRLALQFYLSQAPPQSREHKASITRGSWGIRDLSESSQKP